MEFDTLLKPEIQEFINNNLTVSITKLALQKNPFPQIVWVDLLHQIAAKAKAAEKLPTWFQTKNIIYPSKISLEQTSSEITAAYKATLVFGDSLIDLTGGFGIDDFYFAKNFKKVIHCEINENLHKIVQHNYKQLNITNIACVFGNSLEILQNINQTFDCIYIDPSRRNDTKGKVFLLTDCLPNVPELLHDYFKFSKNILIKAAPVLDITLAINQLQFVKKVHVVAIQNEVKELLFEIEEGFSNPVEIIGANYSNQWQKCSFQLTDIPFDTKFLSEPLQYIYEPNAALLKTGGFNQIAKVFQVDKLHQHSHLYTSNTIIPFFGRTFKVVQKFDYSKLYMKLNLENKKANITTRNFPETVENIRKKWKITDGGNLYCFFTTDLNNKKIVLLCQKI